MPGSKLGKQVAAKAGLTLDRTQRLRRRSEFLAVYKRGRRLGGPHLIIFYRANGLPYTRLGLAVLKKHFRHSWLRHRIRRRLREAYRLNKLRFCSGYDLVIGAQGGVRRGGPTVRTKTQTKGLEESLSVAEIQRELLQLADKAGLLKDKLQSR